MTDHFFDAISAVASGLYPETRYPVPSCQPMTYAYDGNGVARYPLPLSRWTCPECGAVWQFEVIVPMPGAAWRLIATSTPTEGSAS